MEENIEEIAKNFAIKYIANSGLPLEWKEPMGEIIEQSFMCGYEEHKKRCFNNSNNFQNYNLN